MRVWELWGLFLKKEFRKWVITTQTLTKSQEDIENELRGDFLVYLSVPEVDQPGCSHAISHHCSVYFKKLSSSTKQHGPTLWRLPPLCQSIHPSILDILVLMHLLCTFPITLISSSPHTYLLPADTIFTCHQLGETCPKPKGTGIKLVKK